MMRQCFEAIVLNKYKASYEVCDVCGYLKAFNPHWIDESYSKAIADADTGLVSRNINIANKISRILYWLVKDHKHEIFLDIAGGYGLLTRIMRDNGFNFFWSDKYCQNLVATGFEYSAIYGNCLAITAIEALEHVTDPVEFISNSLKLSGSKTIIFTTELYKDNPPNPAEWWYYTFSTGQHISFFKYETLKKVAENLELNFVTANGVHIFTDQIVSPFKLKLLTNKFFSIFPTFWIKYKLGSKTFLDHKTMLNLVSKG